MASDTLLTLIVAWTGIGGTMAGAVLAQRGDQKKDQRAVRRYWMEQRLLTYQEFLSAGRRWSDRGVHRIQLALGVETGGTEEAQDEVSAYRAVLERVRLLATPDVWSAAAELDKAWEERSNAYIYLAFGLPDPQTEEIDDETRDAVHQLEVAVSGAEQNLELVTERFAGAVRCELGIGFPPGGIAGRLHRRPRT